MAGTTGTAAGGTELKPGWRRWWLPVSGALVLALAAWTRAPTLPNILPFAAVRGDEFAAARALEALRGELAETVAVLQRAAAAALAAPPQPDRAFEALRGTRGPSGEWGLVLYENGRPLAWAGSLRIATDTIASPLTVVATPFYTVVAVSRESTGEQAGGALRRAVATAVVAAAPPADRIAGSVAGRVSERHPIAGFVIAALAPRQVARPLRGGTAVLRADDGRPLLLAAATPLSPGEVRLSTVQRARTRIAIAFGGALIAFMGVTWRVGSASWRAGAIGVALAALAVVPFNAFSGQARLFDPTYFFAPGGGPWTANAGVFLLTSIVLALAAIAVVRGAPRVRSRVLALSIAAALAALGFLLIREMAEGIGQPARGVPFTIWLAWQVPLFLSTLAVLLPIGWLVSSGLFRRRRLTRRSFLVFAVAAGIIASALVWLTTVGQRIRLAEADIAALQRGEDDYLDVLLVRLTDALRAGPPPLDRVELLRRYAQSELAIAGYSFALTSWDLAGRVRTRLDLTDLGPDTLLAPPVVARALASNQAQIETVPGPVGRMWLAVVPHADLGATSIAVLPRTQLVQPGSFAPLLGLPMPPVEEPAYTMYLAEGAVPARADTVFWERLGNELHADAQILTTAGPARVHAEIDFRSPEALAQRLVLVLLVNAAVAWMLLLLVMVGERGFVRRARVRWRHWLGSYRARLTVVLFAFFVIPAVAFTVWGYRRLVADNRYSRQLIVRETLHAASVASGEEPIDEIARRFGTPLFYYGDGVLRLASDPLLEVLAPLGRTLPPGVHLNLNVADELTAAAQQRVGPARILMGYRSTDRGEVLGAPARGTDALLARRADDLTVLLLFATAVGALAAFWLSGLAAHQFGRPIAVLRRAARAVARGERRPPELPRAPAEFEPVFTAFRRMSADLERSRVELARAERVLAWGEMARQVAHEIKNPLTPMRLGVQYLQRARNDPRVDFDSVFQENTRRILAEIDRLDEIARAFSRYGSAPAALPPAEAVDVALVLRDLVAFERMGGGLVEWRLTGTDGECLALARREELREVLMNIFENARGAHARSIGVSLDCGPPEIGITVADDGAGIPPDVLPRIFEPHFSTRTTGSGLGLAISRRLLDAWGGSITIDSEPGRGTTVRITLRPAAEPWPPS